MSQKKKRQVTKGTGKRYESSKPHPLIAPLRVLPPPPSHAEAALRKHISQFCLSKRFKEDFERAFEQYMGPEAIQMDGDQKVLVFDEEGDDFPGFQEWFYFDYVLQSGDRIIDVFAKEVGPGLSRIQRQILSDWLATNRLRLLEAQSVEPGIGETMQDLLSGEEFHLNDISFSYNASRWMIALVRPILTQGRWNFTGSGILLTPFEKNRIVKAANELWSAYQKKYPNADLLNFYRDHSLDLLRVGNEIQAERRKPKKLITAEGHTIISAKSEFEIKGDARQVEKALDETEEFIFANEEKRGKFAASQHYNWLLRGRSAVMEAPKDQSSSADLKLTSSWTAGPGMPEFRNLGDLYLSKKDLTLTCMSRERLEAGKQLLIAILGNKIHHRQDLFEEFNQQPDNSDRINEEDYPVLEGEYDEEGEKGDESEIVEQEMIERMTLRWLDTPDHEGVTPRQSAQTWEGRELLRETLKCLEFIEEEALKSGKRPPLRLDLIRDELGLQ